MPLTSLSRVSDRDFPPNAFDVRGWKVRTAIDDEGVGRVDDMLIDETGELRYLDVDLGMFKKRVLVPIRHARVDRSDDVVWVDGMVKEQFESIPAYDGNPDSVAPSYVSGVESGYRTAIRQDYVADDAQEPRLQRLHDLEDFRVAKGDPDPRGWKVVAADGVAIGEVTELIVDTGSMEARYLDCDVEERKLELEPIDRHVLIPVEHARIDRDHKSVIVDGLPSHRVSDYPVYAGLPIADDVRRTIDRTFRGERRAEVTERTEERAAFGREREDRATARDSDRFYSARREAGQTHTIRAGEQEVRIRVAGDEIIVEKRPRDEEVR